MSKEMEFFIFLLEQYAHSKGKTADVVLKEWDKHGITQKIYDNYEMYHQESLDNAYADIDNLVTTGSYAW